MWWTYQECSSCVKLVDHRHNRINIQFDIIHFVLVIIIICSKPVLYQRCFVLIVSGPNCNACMMLQPLNLQKYWDPIKISIQFLMVNRKLWKWPLCQFCVVSLHSSYSFLDIMLKTFPSLITRFFVPIMNEF